jgi:Holliday junction DNA helicase RuvA
VCSSYLIGKKTAERLVVELRAKVGASAGLSPVAGPAGGEPGAAPSGDTTLRDAILALTALGYKQADADAAVRRAQIALGAGATTEKLIKRALTG